MLSRNAFSFAGTSLSQCLLEFFGSNMYLRVPQVVHGETGKR